MIKVQILAEVPEFAEIVFNGSTSLFQRESTDSISVLRSRMPTMRKDTLALDNRAAWYVPLRSASAAWRLGLKAALSRDPNEIAPYKILSGAVDPFTKSYSNGWNFLARSGNHSCKPFDQRDDSVCVDESSEPDVLTISGLQRREHRRTGSDFFGFHPLGFNCCSSGDEQPHHFELSTVISGRRIAPAVDCPSQ